ncbi:BURP domain protein RD22 [Zea mays]|uniref:BURP domain protein RD22 n=1 Tax=Zea mays TaxID=4577 RepID=A0A1D6KM66_MAIZE|nr:BURP domain protein RD22 [Zea mays]
MHTRATRYWRRGAMPGMDAFAAVSLLATLFLVRAAAAHPPAAAADAMTPTDYWRAVLPETPMPRAILDLLTTSTGIFNLLQIHTVSAFCFPFKRPSKTRYF